MTGDETSGPYFFRISVDGVSYEIFLPDSETDYIQKKIRQESKPYEIEMLRDIQSRIDEGDLFIDVGSNIGNHAIYVASARKCRVVAVEPNRHLCESIERSVEANNLKGRVEVKCLALGEEESAASFACDMPENLGGQSIAIGAGEIQVCPLDRLAFDGPVKVIKIDVEGMEMPVLRGASAVLRRDRPFVYVECLDEPQFRLVSGFLAEMDYGYWDTFNASPTHLFIPNEKLTLEKRLSRLQFMVEEGNYRSSYKLRDTRQRLDEANKKYRLACDQIAQYKVQVASLDAEKKNSEVNLKADREKLEAAILECRESTERYSRIESRLEEELARLETARSELERVRAELAIQEEGRALVDQELAVSKALASLAESQAVARLNDWRQWQNETQERHEAELKRLLADLSESKERLAFSQEQYCQAVSESRVHADRVAEALERVRDSERKQALLEQKLAELNEARHQTLQQLMKAEARLEGMQEQLEMANQRRRDADERVQGLEQRLLHEESARQKLMGEQAACERSLTAQLHDQEKKTLVSEAAVSVMRAQLDAANLKYRESTEHCAQLKEKLAHEAAEHVAVRARVEQIQVELQTVRRESEAELQTRQALLAAQEAAAEQLRADLAEAEQELLSTCEELRQLQAESAATSASLDAERRAHGEVREDLLVSLDRANAKYREATEQYTELKARADVQAGELIQLQSVISDLMTARETLASELETTKAAQRSEQQQAEQLKLAVLQGKRTLASLQTELEMLRQQKIAAENKVVKTRGMISFRLGYALIHGFKSFSALRALPGQLLDIHRDARQLKADKLKSGANAAPAAARLAAAANAAARRPSIPPTQLMRELSDPVQALKALKVAGIMDEFTYHSYAPECSLLQLSVAHWQQELEGYQPQLLFIESAWRGKDEQWGSKVGHMSEELQGIINWCRQHKVPTVFWNKEDPVHFETFLNTARLFDYVFTTDIDCIHRYKAALGHEEVYLLPFACQPQSNNPVEKYARKDAFCFAGAYYVRYPERTRDLGNFVSALAEYRPVEIYDRNFGKDDPNYQFPPEYQPFIVGNLPYEQIDKAYKGYRYAINLNSIKQSQSMFARRVFELLACNTVTVSNFSRGVRLMFGDLVIATDSGTEIVRRLQAYCDDELSLRKFRLAGLRKVMLHHTYQDRLAYVVSRVQHKPLSSLLPSIVVTAYAKNQAQLDAILASYERQHYAERRLLLVVPANFAPQTPAERDDIVVVSAEAVQTLIADCVGAREWVAGMVPDDYYGPNYLLDLALATRYSKAGVIGKKNHFVWSAANGLVEAYPSAQYRQHPALPARAAMTEGARLEGMTLRDWTTSLHVRQLEADEVLAIDEFNYCKNGHGEDFGAQQIATVTDLEGLDAGLPAHEITQRAEQIAPAEASPDEAPVLSGAELARYFKPAAGAPCTLNVSGTAWEAESHLPADKHEYLYAIRDLAPAELGFGAMARFHFDVTPGLSLQLVLVFLDAQKQRISHVIKTANRNQEAEIPLGTAWIRLGLRIYGSGAARINGLVLGHRPLRPADVLGKANTLLLTNHYPAYDDLYRNGFVHSRVAAYAERGVKVDVFRLRAEEALAWHEFNNIDVITGSPQALHKLLEKGCYKRVLVHFLDAAMWEVLQHYIDRIKVVVWVHGAEIQPWHRREYNYETAAQLDIAKIQSETRMQFWRGLLGEIPSNLELVFVSRYFAEEVMEDLGFRIPESHYHIIHNPIDTDLFSYQPKPVEQRKKILSIRPYASRKYANDLSVQAILALSRKPIFNELEFRMIGDGKLFDETLEPLRLFPNVIIERRFLSHTEIAALHKDYGIFLCPTRMDAQGVSRDEAMSSGLVPVTNGVTAIPEFVDDSCGVLAAGEEFAGMAEGIERLYSEPDSFVAMSAAAALRVREQSAAGKVIQNELLLF